MATFIKIAEVHIFVVVNIMKPAQLNFSDSNEKKCPLKKVNQQSNNKHSNLYNFYKLINKNELF